MTSLNNRENEIDKSPIFIVGMPRSGTTLMRLMLSVHPNIAITRETHFLPNWWKRYRDLDLNDRDNFEAFWEDFSTSNRFPNFVAEPTLVKEQILASKQIDLKTIFTSIMEVLASSRNKPRWAEKTPQHYKYVHVLLDWYPQARIIWMLRDPRSVVSSTIERWKNKTVEDCAAKWRKSVLNFQEQWSRNEKVQIMKYEELVSDAELHMRKICDFLEEEFCPEMIGDRTKVNKNHNSKGKNKLQNKAPTSERVDRWRSKLSVSQIATVENIAKDAMLRWGYQLKNQNLINNLSKFELFK